MLGEERDVPAAEVLIVVAAMSHTEIGFSVMAESRIDTFTMCSPVSAKENSRIKEMFAFWPSPGQGPDRILRRPIVPVRLERRLCFFRCECEVLSEAVRLVELSMTSGRKSIDFPSKAGHMTTGQPPYAMSPRQMATSHRKSKSHSRPSGWYSNSSLSMAMTSGLKTRTVSGRVRVVHPEVNQEGVRCRDDGEAGEQDGDAAHPQGPPPVALSWLGRRGGICPASAPLGQLQLQLHGSRDQASRAVMACRRRS